ESVRSNQAGAVVLFLGTVREMTEGRQTVALDYDGYPEMAEAKLRELEAEARSRWPVIEAGIVHRLGHLELGDISVAVAVSSGTDALVLALRALGIGPGDEVVTVPNSFVASAACISLVGAKPVFVDAGADYNMDPALLERALTRRTRAILPVHLTGEDCAQAVGAEHRGRRVGSFGAVGCFSLHPLKTLNACGDGGVLTTNDKNLCERLRILRNIGLKTRDDCVEWSGNSRLDTLQAAILLVKLGRLESWTRARRRNAAFYQRALAGVPQVRLPKDRPCERAVYHTFVIRAQDRDGLRRHLARRGIETAIHYPVPIHLHRAARGLGLKRGSFPETERQAREILSLPVYPEMTRRDLSRVAGAIKEFYR
ncbi:MAG: DegT/DnrJ/EryC1/StrS family aminotransferase, partial [Elusimicrobia bacterium]|nr:DegT/DnrJ/EryC1/StrS family aminotransferase [Elusimicrobiota bacterium]